METPVISSPETRIQKITSETEKIFSRMISDKISSIHGEGSIVNSFELPSNSGALRSSGVDSRLADIFSEDNESGSVEITVFTNEVRIFNPCTLRSLFVFSVKPYLRLDGLIYSSPSQLAADAFIQALNSDEFQNPTSRIYTTKEEQFAAYKNADSILRFITASQLKQ